MINSQNRVVILFVVLYLVFYVVFFSPIFLSGNILAFGDSWKESVPDFFASRSLWWHDVGSGFPAAADPLKQVTNPLFFLCSLMPFGAWNIYMLAAYLIGSTGTAGFIFSLTKNKTAAFAAGLIFMLNGFLTINLMMESMIHAICYLPVVIWSLHELRKSFRARWYCIGAVALALSGFTGYPQTFVHVGMLSGFYALFLSWDAGKFRPRIALRTISMLAIGATMCLVHILPCYALAQSNWRSKMTFAEHVTLSLDPYKLVTIFFPAFLGLHKSSIYSLDYFGSGLPECSYAYAGIFCLLLALIGIFYDDFREKVFWLATATLSFLLSLGAATPLSRLFFLIPVYNNFRAQSRHLCEFAFEISVLAGMGISYLLSTRFKLANLKILLTVFSALFVLAAVVIPVMGTALNPMVEKQFGTHLESLPWRSWAVGIPYLLFAASLTVIILWSRITQEKIRIACLLGLVVLDLGSFAWFAPWHYVTHSTVELTAPNHIASLRTELNASHQRLLPIRGCDASRDEVPANFARDWNVPCASIYSALTSPRYLKLMSMYEGGFLTPQDAWKNDADQSFDIAAVRYLSMPSENANGLGVGSPDHEKRTGEAIHRATTERWTLDKSYGPSCLIRNTRALPLAWIVNDVHQLLPDDCLKAVKTSMLPDGSKFNAATQALVEDSVQVDQPSVQGKVKTSKLPGDPILNAAVQSVVADLPASQTSAHSTVEILKHDDSATIVKTTSSLKSLLVVSIPYYRGAQASIDGARTSLIPADYAFESVIVPAGTHEIRLWHELPLFTAGLIATCLSLIALSTICIWHRFTRRS